MKFEEVIIEEENIDIFYDSDGFYAYWMNISDPRGTYLRIKEDFLFEQSCGSGEWDY